MRPLNTLSEVLEETLRRLELTEAALDARAVLLWPQIVGPQMAQASEARGVRAGTLLVVTRSGAWSQEFSFQKTLILGRYRERLGRDYLKDLRFEVGQVRGAAEVSARHAPPEAEVRRIRLGDEEIERIREASETDDTELAQAIRRALTREAQLRAWRLEHGGKACPRCGAAHHTPQDLCPACRQDDIVARAPLPGDRS